MPDLIWSILPDADAGFGIEMVEALDAAHAQDIARAQHPKGRFSIVPVELFDGQVRHKLLQSWLNGGSGDGV